MPADRVAASLILQDEPSDSFGKTSALPVTLQSASVVIVRIRGLCGLDGVGRGTEVVFSHVRHTGGLTGRVRGESGSAAQRSSGTHRVSARRSCLHHRHLAAGPRAGRIDRIARTGVHRFLGLEQRQYVLRTLGGPQCQQVMVRVGEQPPTTDSDHARVANFGKDHTTSLPVPIPHLTYRLTGRLPAVCCSVGMMGAVEAGPIVSVRRVQDDDRGWVAQTLVRDWASTSVARGGELVEAVNLPGYVAMVEDRRVGLALVDVTDRGYEVVVISTTEPRRGVGRALMERCFTEANALAAGRVWLVTTNNIAAISFYQSLGMDLRALHRHAVRKAREVKPTIPSHDEAGIPIDHELEFELVLRT